MTLIGVALAGGLIWFATWLGPPEDTGEYWAAMGAIAGAGLVLALSQLAGGWTKWGVPSISPSVLVLAFLPALVAGGWILVAAQPEGSTARERVLDWSASLGISGLVGDLTTVVGAIAFGIGLVFGLVFDTTGPRSREEVVEHDRYADEPTTAERERAAAADTRDVDRDRQPVAVGARDDTHVEDGTREERTTPAAPQPEPDSEPRRRSFSFFRR
jgi:hypothetical protein